MALPLVAYFSLQGSPFGQLPTHEVLTFFRVPLLLEGDLRLIAFAHGAMLAA